MRNRKGYPSALLIFLCFILGLPPALAEKNSERDKAGVTVYYFNFNRGTFGALTPTSIKDTAFKKRFPSARDTEVAWLMHLISRKYGPGTCNKRSIRLLIERGNKQVPILVDADGNVCIGKAEYSLRPSTLVSLYQALTEMFPQSLDFRRHELSVLKQRQTIQSQGQPTAQKRNKVTN